MVAKDGGRVEETGRGGREGLGEGRVGRIRSGDDVISEDPLSRPVRRGGWRG